MKLFLLDRNVITHIAEDFKRRPAADAAKIKNIDKKGNKISVILSTLEGNEGLPQSPLRFFDGATADFEKIKNFFKHATLDVDFLKKSLVEASLALTEHQSEAFSRHKEMTRFLQDHVYQNLSTKNIAITRDLIAKKSAETGTPITHIIVLCGLAALYGYDPARRALKCLKPNSTETEIDRSKRIYNAISDLMIVSNIALIHDVYSRANPNRKQIMIKFLTFDSDLEKVLSKIKINNVSSYDDMAGDRNTYTEYTPCMSLFPKLDDFGKKELTDWMTSLSPKNNSRLYS